MGFVTYLYNHKSFAFRKHPLLKKYMKYLKCFGLGQLEGGITPTS